MGCDIHFYVEVRKDGQWQSADRWTDDPYQDDEGGARKCVAYEDRFYAGRNYDLFAILANVRNGSGFAGCDTGTGFVPICQPKGLPEGVTPEVQADSDGWGVDGHSHSWHTLADLLAYDWTQRTKHRGYISGPEYAEWSRWRKDRGESPESYSGDVFGSSVNKTTPGGMDGLVAEIKSRFESNEGPWWNDFIKAVGEELGYTYCQVQWEETYCKSAGHFWQDTMPRLLRLGKPEDVRIVFWFDN